jgi:hypothetical protein
MGGTCSTHGANEKYNILFGKPERKRLLERHRRRWEANMRMDLREIGWEVWTGCIWLRKRTRGELL